jgi:FtsH-binding integral membrane protein
MSNFDRNAYGQQGFARADGMAIDQGLRAYMLGIYNHMVLGLAITALVSLGIGMLGRTSPVVVALYASPLKWLVILAPLAFVMVLSFRFERMSYQGLLGTFWAFAATMGLSMGSIFYIYQIGSIAQVFFITTAAFGGLSLHGYTTKRSLSGMGSFLIMGLFGLIIASLVNLFLASSAMQFALNVIGVLIFAGLTAWDTQRLKDDYPMLAGSGEMLHKASVMGALSLYLNFVNMFQMLLSLLGNRE